MRWITLTAALLFALPLSAKRSKAKSKAKVPLVHMEWAVRVAGHQIGEASLDVGRLKKRGGTKMRPVRFQADVRPTGLSVFKFAGKATTWVKKGWTPVNADWKWQELTRNSEVKASWKRNRVDGRFWLDGKERKRVRGGDRRGHMSDVVSILPWLMHQEIKTGGTIKTTTFTGNQIYRVSGKVGEKGTVALPDGERSAVPIEFTAVRPGKTRTFTVWVDPTDNTPLRLVFKYKLLGDVDAVLTRSVRRS